MPAPFGIVYVAVKAVVYLSYQRASLVESSMYIDLSVLMGM